MSGFVVLAGVLLAVPAAEAASSPAPSSSASSATSSSGGARSEKRIAAVTAQKARVKAPSARKARAKRTSAASGAAAGKRTHIVRSGDTVASIARRYGVSANSVRASNGIIDDRLFRGARLIIDGSSAASAGSSSMTAGKVGPTLRCPVRGGTFMNDWGFPRDDGGRFHEGTDVFAPRGATVVAPASGTIVFGSNPLGGTTFNLTTDTGWVIYGAHLSKTIGASRHVKAGEPIARVGNSGNAAGGDTHLHVGLKRLSGVSINPYPSLRAACS